MSSFKYKSNRVKYRSDVKTLDEIHNEQMNTFKDDRNSLPKLKRKLKNLEKKKELLDNDVKLYSIDEIKDRAVLKDEITDIKNKIRRITTNEDELEYMTKVYDVIFNYYDITEGKYYNNSEFEEESVEEDMNITESETENENENESDMVETSDRLVKLNEISKKKRKIKKSVKRRNLVEDNVNNSSCILNFLSGNVDNQKNNNFEITSNRATLQDEYLSLTDEGYVCNKIKSNPIKICNTCNKEKTLIQSEGIYVCQNCGEMEHVIIESEIPSHKDAINEKPKYPYKKINHLIEKLNQFQSKETNNIPDDVFEKINNEIKKRRKSKDDITLRFIKDVLKKYRFNKFYENSQFIFSKITGIPPPILSRDQEEEVKKRFRLLEEPFMKHRPKDRSNFLNYSFVLHKIFLIMGLTNHAKYFTLLKSKEKLRLQDIVWKKICNELNWQFHSSSNISSN